jgi:hypothetical protein
MTLLRILLLAIFVYYAVRLLARWIFPPDGGGPGVRRREGGKGEEESARYRDLTSQTIEDADYEEIEGKNEEQCGSRRDAASNRRFGNGAEGSVSTITHPFRCWW